LYPASSWRLILDGSGDGAWNMAVDEAILQAVAGGRSPATLRFYLWQPPCLSLGRSQPPDEADLQACSRTGFGHVRRPTGGRAILHKDELTYSICLPLDDPRAAGDIVESYRRLSEGLAEGLRLLGVAAERAESHSDNDGVSAACFDTPAGHEITVVGRKLLGSAQFRVRGALLQHGSLPLFGDIAAIVDFLALPEEQREALRARLRVTALTLEEAAGRKVSFREAAKALCQGITEALNVRLEEGHLTSEEKASADTLHAGKYASPEWWLGKRLQENTGVPEVQ